MSEKFNELTGKRMTRTEFIDWLTKNLDWRFSLEIAIEKGLEAGVVITDINKKKYKKSIDKGQLLLNKSIKKGTDNMSRLQFTEKELLKACRKHGADSSAKTLEAICEELKGKTTGPQQIKDSIYRFKIKDILKAECEKKSDSLIKTEILVSKEPDIVNEVTKLTVSQWADEYRALSAEDSAEPGKRSTDRAPYNVIKDPVVVNEPITDQTRFTITEDAEAVMQEVLKGEFNSETANLLETSNTISFGKIGEMLFTDVVASRKTGRIYHCSDIGTITVFSEAEEIGINKLSDLADELLEVQQFFLNGVKL